MLNPTELAEMLTVKLCHDLSGPIGAVNNGVELLKDDHDKNLYKDSLELIEMSAQEAVARISLFRQAYGTSNFQEHTNIDSINILLENFFKNKNLTFTWTNATALTNSQNNIANDIVKLILNTTLVLSNILIQGGNITIEMTPKQRLILRGEGRSIHILDDTLKTLNNQHKNKDDITIKNLQPYLVSQIVKKLNTTLTLEHNKDYVQITINSL